MGRWRKFIALALYFNGKSAVPKPKATSGKGRQFSGWGGGPPWSAYQKGSKHIGRPKKRSSSLIYSPEQKINQLGLLQVMHGRATKRACSEPSRAKNAPACCACLSVPLLLSHLHWLPMSLHLPPCARIFHIIIYVHVWQWNPWAFASCLILLASQLPL